MNDERYTRQTLLQKLQLNEGEHCWEDFAQYYEGYIYVVIRNLGIKSEDIEDLLQEVLLKVWKGLPNYSYEQGKCRFRTWLCVVIRNTVFNFYNLRANRDQKKHISSDDRLENINMISEAEIDILAEKEWKSYISNMAWENLKNEFSEISRNIFEASLDEDNNTTLATNFNVPESSVRVYKMRIRKSLHKEIIRLNLELGG
jgi:RNA polymerase sigma factor (sigma-70 family)